MNAEYSCAEDAADLQALAVIVLAVVAVFRIGVLVGRRR